ncbi:unnamed protein product [Dovyalis caffra]|uniref:Uncharacterized protein n=1 Tax=Dovyalis caffra TaxID=77055 RepID=A0AAV1SWZ7_9ROSI|nr:unnamed protein product [Dovyalis caffra]
MSSLEVANKVVMKWLEPNNNGQDQRKKKIIDDLYKQIDDMKKQFEKQVNDMKKQFDHDNHLLYQRYTNAAKELVIFGRAYYDLMEKVQQQSNPSPSSRCSPNIESRRKNIDVHDGSMPQVSLPLSSSSAVTNTKTPSGYCY